MITSALAGEGKSSLALGLALSAARLHQRVLLIDADLRRPSLHTQLNLPNEEGLSTLLTVDADIASHSSVQSSEDSFIDILTAGPTPEDPAKLLSSQRMRQLMVNFEQKYDLVLLDAPPVLGLVDAILAGSFCSGVVLVSRIGQVTRKK
jgi:capsular exopolysaccharide synthesis family protein